MKEKILVFLKSKLTGVSESFLLGVADTWSKTIKKEEDIETTFTDGIIDTLKFSATELQKEGDRRVTQAQLDLKKWQEEHGLNEDGTPKKKPGRPPIKDDDSHDPEEPAWFTAFKEEQAKSVKDLQDEIAAQKQEKTLTQLTEKVKSHDKLKGIPASFLKGRNLTPKSEDDIDQLVASIESDYNGFTQEMAEKGVVISEPPQGGGQAGDKVTIDDYLADKFPEESEN